MAKSEDRLIDLSRAGKGNFRRRRGIWVEALWVLTEFILVTNPLQPFSSIRRLALKAFGAKIGKNVIIRPRTRIKFPWNLTVGDNSWIGEGVWFHNQDNVEIGCNVVVSQEAFITTGSHDTRRTMDLVVKPIRIKDGVWITSRCILLQGITIGRNTIVTPGSVVNKSLPGDSIFGGNPAVFIKRRELD